MNDRGLTEPCRSVNTISYPKPKRRERSKIRAVRRRVLQLTLKTHMH